MQPGVQVCQQLQKVLIRRLIGRPVGRDEDGLDVAAAGLGECGDDVVHAEVAVALGGAAFAECQQVAQGRVPGHRGGQQHKRPIGRYGRAAKVHNGLDAGAGDEGDAAAGRGGVGADEPGHGVQVGHGDGAVAEFGGAIDEFVGV